MAAKRTPTGNTHASVRSSFMRAMKLLAADPRANGWKIKMAADRLPPKDALIVLRALHSHPDADKATAQDFVAEALARAGLFEEAIALATMCGSSSASPRHRLYDIGERALDAEDYDHAERAFESIKEREKDVLTFIGLTIAQKKRGKTEAAAASLAKAWTLNESEAKENPVDWKRASSCHRYLFVEMCRAMILTLEDDKPAAMKLLSETKRQFRRSITLRGVRNECLDFLTGLGSSPWGVADMIRLSGLDGVTAPRGLSATQPRS